MNSSILSISSRGLRNSSRLYLSAAQSSNLRRVLSPQILNARATHDITLFGVRALSSVSSAPKQPKNVSKKKPAEISDAKFNLYGKRNPDWWTGKAPQQGVCPGVDKHGKITSLPALNLSPGVTKKQIQDYFDNTWTLTEVLFSAFQGHKPFFIPPPHNLRHPLIFYYGHVACLYVNTFLLAKILPAHVNAEYEKIFEMGVDEMSWDDMSKNHMIWPSVEQVHAYRKVVYEIVCRVIQSIPDEELATKGITQDSKWWGLALAFEHERIHIETSACLMNEMPAEFFKFPENFPKYFPIKMPTSTEQTRNTTNSGSPAPVQGKDYPANELIKVSASDITLGKPRNYPSFGWDNEYGFPASIIKLPTFHATKYLITNGEFYEFVQHGGYSEKCKQHWSAEGWSWRSFRNNQHPTFWRVDANTSYFQRFIFDWVPMQWDHPVIVNYHEATAYAAWRQAHGDMKLSNATKSSASDKPLSLRLTTELECRSMRGEPARHISGPMQGMAVDPVMDFGSDGSHSMVESKYKHNLNLSYGSTSPVTAFPANKKGIHDVMGNAWSWCLDYFSPLKGFKVHPFYELFSSPCFDGKHHCIQNGSFLSTGDEASVYARFHFRPHFLQQASFRLVHCEADAQQNKGPLTVDTGCEGPFSTPTNPFR